MVIKRQQKIEFQTKGEKVELSTKIFEEKTKKHFWQSFKRSLPPPSNDVTHPKTGRYLNGIDGLIKTIS